jgi:hypothetical protein
MGCAIICGDPAGVVTMYHVVTPATIAH